MRSLTLLVRTVENLWQMLLTKRELAISEAATSQVWFAVSASDCEQDNATKKILDACNPVQASQSKQPTLQK